MDACTLSLRSAKDRYASAAPQDTLAMCSLRAPRAIQDHKRPPLQLVAVVDRSSSMEGAKMALLKQTLGLLCSKAGLRADDKLGLVSFANDASEDLPLCAMDSAGLRKAQLAVEALQAYGGTNISAGLLQGIDAIASCHRTRLQHHSSSASATRVCLLFTDGQANHGITSKEELVLAAQGAMSDCPTAIFTFGFGADHNEDLLIALSRAGASGALFYHIASAEAIPSAFADCLGGLVSVVSQNATLELRPLGGARLGKVLCDAYATTVDGDGAVRVRIGDLYAEDEKDVLVALHLPAAPAAEDEWTLVEGGTDASLAPAPRVAVLEARLRYFSVGGSRMDTAVAELAVARPEDDAEAVVDIVLDEQRNRLLVVDALNKATARADRGDLAGGKALLDEMITCVAASPSAGSAVSKALVDDVRRLAVDYEHAEDYATRGSKRSKGSSMSHTYQRSTHDTPEAVLCAYKGGRAVKGSVKRAWTTA